MLSNTRIEHVLGMGSTFTQDYNCWGATMFVLGAKDHLTWVDNPEISDWLMANCEPVKRPQIGDVLGLFYKDDAKKIARLMHTAVYIGNGRYLHKLGQQKAVVEPLAKVIAHYRNVTNSKLMFRPKENIRESIFSEQATLSTT